MLGGKRILLIISGGIAAYKSLELIRLLQERGAAVRCVLTRAGAEFVTPLSVAALSGEKVHTDLFALTDDSEMGHIRLSREADLLVVAPATADLLARMAVGLADDLASAVLLATDKPVLIAPAMNADMWRHPATRRNLERLERDGIHKVAPGEGELACGETGPGRMAEAADIVAAIEALLGAGPLRGVRALVTSGPTREAIDPVRYVTNRSSGKQGHALAAACARLGADVTLVSGPTHEPNPAGVKVVHIESAREMLAACEEALPVEVAVCAAAVVDWRVAPTRADKIKKRGDGRGPTLRLIENPDILARLSARNADRPELVVGFAAETDALVANATAKRRAKGCDWIVANDVSPETGIMGGDVNTIHLITPEGTEGWPSMSKRAVAERLARRIAEHFARWRSA
ncbi:MAG: bifunctional phosphopantothenoylcysteine decarboxylase/phosphopantothenate--cysteine ligase CoaBC [Alphaproteobacteria bacterium]